jgi:hypothetical protein|tara:strand:- start:312 stop:821 length:510 start_codon:yes stop_codon:yes gene_type:complete
MALTTFSGPVKSKNGFLNTGAGAFLLVSAPIALTTKEHAGRIIGINDADCAITLPTIKSALTASADEDFDIGAVFKIFIYQTAATGITITANAANTMMGQVLIHKTDTASKSWLPAASNKVITLNGGTKGGLTGSYLEITAVYGSSLTANWLVNGDLLTTATAVTPFSD